MYAQVNRGGGRLNKGGGGVRRGVEAEGQNLFMRWRDGGEGNEKKKAGGPGN